jgi:hypothetical protein
VSIPRAVATARWLAEVYQPTIDSIPKDLRSHLEPAEVFHQLLEHRYLMAEERGGEVRTSDALEDYLDAVLVSTPAERQLQFDTGSMPRIIFDPEAVTFET